MAEPVLQVEGLTVGFRVMGWLMPVLNDLSFEVAAGEVLGLVGESGSGKSTALFAAMNYLAGNAEVGGGRVRLRGQDLLGLARPALDDIRGRRIGMVFQDPTGALNPSMRIGEQIGEGLTRHLGLSGPARRARTLAWLERVQMDDPAAIFAKYPHELSGGQKQRAMIALAMAPGPEVLLMDEPTTALDVIVQARILALVRDLCRETDTAIVFVTHDLGAVAQVADRVAVLYAGELMETGTAHGVLQSPRNPYTRGLIAALPRVSGRTAPRAIRGTISRDPARFARCVFAERCDRALPICRETRPALRALAGGGRSRCHLDPAAASDAAARAGPGPDGGGSPPPAVRGMSFALAANRTLAIVGESGSGKTTLARAVLRLVPLSAGRIRFRGHDVAGLSRAELRAYRRQVQIVFQHPTSSLNPRKPVLDLVARPQRLAGQSEGDARAAARAMLAEVGLDESYHRRLPRELSGGELQRVAIARAFVTGPELLILDEPTTALDVSVQASVLQLLLRMKAERGCAFLLISHDLAVVRELADEIIVMRQGQVCEHGPVARIYAAATHAYTRELMAAAPGLG